MARPESYRIEVTYMLYVLAEDEEEACQMVEQDSVDWRGNETPSHVWPDGPIKKLEHVDPSWRGSLPYRLSKHNDGADKTCADIIGDGL